MVSFTSEIPCGNGKLIGYRQADGCEELTFIAESKLCEPAPMWFHFRVEGLCGGDVRFIIANAHQFLRDAPDPAAIAGDHPVYRTPQGQWKRTAHCAYYLDSGQAPVSSFTIPSCPQTVEVAFCYPYSPEMLEEAMGETGVFQKAVIGYSTKGREIPRYTSPRGTLDQLPGVYITCRQHAAEVGGAWVLDGLLRYFGSREGRAGLKGMALWIVPMVDVDGVSEGCYGKDQLAGDMNRSWAVPFPPRAEISAIVQDVARWREQCTPVAYLDIHSPAHEVRGMLLNVHEGASGTQWEFNGKLMEKANEALTMQGKELFSINRVPRENLGSSQGNKNTSASFFQSHLNIPTVLIEASYEGPKSGGVYEIHDYRAYGEAIARALVSVVCQE